jgi:hypothetical protein
MPLPAAVTIAWICGSGGGKDGKTSINILASAWRLKAIQHECKDVTLLVRLNRTFISLVKVVIPSVYNACIGNPFEFDQSNPFSGLCATSKSDTPLGISAIANIQVSHAKIV